MPWSTASFRDRHAKHLKGRAAQEAAKMANAMIEKGVPENVAIPTAIKHGNSMMGGERAAHRYRKRS